MSRFDDEFQSVQSFITEDDYMLVLSREHFDRETAAKMMSAYAEREIDPTNLEEDRVRFGMNASFDCNSPLWFTGARGKGSKAVWTLDSYWLRLQDMEAKDVPVA